MLHRLAAQQAAKESHTRKLQTAVYNPIPYTTEMAGKDLLNLKRHIECDSGFDSDDMGIDEMDCSDPLALSGRCDLHKGLRIEVTKESLSMRSIANVVIALQRLKHIERVQSTEFSDRELFNIFMENVIEETIVINLKCSESRLYSRQDKVVQCSICDKSKKTLVHNFPYLLAFTLKGGNEESKARFNLSAYTPPNCKGNSKGQAVCLGIVKSNFFLSCTSDNGTPSLVIEEVKDKASLQAVKETDDMERFLFLRNSSGDSLNTFESVKYPGWFITTSKDEKQPVQMSKQQTSHLQLFSLYDEEVVLQSEV